MEAKYTAEATAWGGRAGHTASSDGVLDLQLSVPKEMGGDGGPGTNPEQLFAAGYSSCFHGALKLVAGQAKVDASESAVTARVSIGDNDKGVGFMLSVDLIAEMPGVDAATAQELMEKAHQVCPYSNATRGNIDVNLSVEAS